MAASIKGRSPPQARTRSVTGRLFAKDIKRRRASLRAVKGDGGRARRETHNVDGIVMGTWGNHNSIVRAYPPPNPGYGVGGGGHSRGKFERIKSLDLGWFDRSAVTKWLRFATLHPP